MAQPNPSNSHRPSRPGAAGPGSAASPPGGALHTGTPAQERRSSDRHRPLRGRNSHRPSRPGAAGPQTPPVLPAGPFTPARPPRNAGPHRHRPLRGRNSHRPSPRIRRAEPGTPVFQELPSPGRAAGPGSAASPPGGALHTGTPAQERRSSDRHRPLRGRNSHRPSPWPRIRNAASPPGGALHTARPPGTPASTPASPAPRAKLPSPLPAWRCRIRNAASPPGGALHTGTPAQERRSSDRHRPLRGRNSHRPSRPGAAGPQAPPVLPAGPFTPARPPRNAGLQTGIARSAGETPIAPPGLALPAGQPGALHTGTPARNAGLQTGIARNSPPLPPGSRNSHRPSRPGAAGPQAPPVLPAGPFTPARPPRNAGLQTGIARSAGETPIAPPGLALQDQERRQSSRRGPSHRHARPGTPVFRPASPAPRAKLPSPLPAWRQVRNAASPPGGAFTPHARRTPASSDRHRQLRGRNSHRPSRPGAAGSGTPPVLPAGPSHRHARPGTPVFRPASPAPRAKLPSPLPAWRCRIRNAASPPGGGLHTGTPAQERRSSDRHRPLRGRNSHRPSRPGAAGSGTPPVLPAGLSHRHARWRQEGTPVFRPASPAPRAKLPSPLPAWRRTK